MFDTSILLHSTRWVSDDSFLVRYLEPLLSSFFLLFDSCFSYDTLISLLAAIQKTETAGLLSQNTLLGYSSCQISLFSFILLSHTPHFSLSSSASLISSLLAVALICFFFPLSSPRRRPSPPPPNKERRGKGRWTDEMAKRQRWKRKREDKSAYGAGGRKRETIKVKQIKKGLEK